jgi:CRP/FNR family transcriptional regulator/CRP/FNR family cyclic AMP-dependent transcriptional regulator
MADLTKRVNYLKTVPLFRDLSRPQLQKIARVADLVDVSAGRSVVEEGTYRAGGGPAFFVIADGEADVLVSRRRVATLRAGESFGEMSLLDGKPRSATVKAKTRLSLYRIRSWDFHKLVKSEPGIALGLLKTVAGRLRDVEERPRRTRR